MNKIYITIIIALLVVSGVVGYKMNKWHNLAQYWYNANLSQREWNTEFAEYMPGLRDFIIVSPSNKYSGLTSTTSYIGIDENCSFVFDSKEEGYIPGGSKTDMYITKCH